MLNKRKTRFLCRDQKERGTDSAAGRELHRLCDRVPGPETIPGPPAWGQGPGRGPTGEGLRSRERGEPPRVGRVSGLHWKLCPVLGSAPAPFSLPES